MIEVHIGSTVFKCSTPEEAVRVHQLAAGGPQSAPVRAAQPPAPTRLAAPATRARNGKASAFLKKLEGVAGQELDVSAMVKLMGVKHQNGIGPRLARIRKSLLDENIVLDDYIEKIKPEFGGPSHWVVRIPGQGAAA